MPKTYLPLTTRLKAALLASTLVSTQALAGPWIDSGDARLRHHIQVLADQGIITSPVTTWPLMWASIAGDINSASAKNLDPDTYWSLKHVKFAYKQQTRSVNINASATVRSDVNPFGTFGNTQREKNEARGEIDLLGDRFAARLTGSYSNDPLDGDEFRADGSYLAFTLGNWAFSAGAIDRWWGPGWNSSLILSSNARPVPGLAIQRSQSTAFETPWLSWLGTWQLNAFAGQLESDRHIPDPYLLGTRFSFKPASQWEIGLTRTAQWGGEGRPQNWDSFKNLLLGKDNSGSGGIAADGSNEPGNQLAGIDIRYNFAWNQTHNATYIQYVGEDEAGSMPSRGIIQLGLESSFNYNDIQHRIIIEATDTAIIDADKDKISKYNYIYEHGIYRSGYRYKNRPIGASVDNDSQEITLIGQHYFSNGHQLHWSIASIDINRDNTNAAAPGGSVYDLGVDTTYIQASYKLPLSKHWMAEAGLNFSSETITYNDEELDDGGYLAVRFKY